MFFMSGHLASKISETVLFFDYLFYCQSLYRIYTDLMICIHSIYVITLFNYWVVFHCCCRVQEKDMKSFPEFAESKYLHLFLAHLISSLSTFFYLWDRFGCFPFLFSLILVFGPSSILILLPARSSPGRTLLTGIWFLWKHTEHSHISVVGVDILLISSWLLQHSHTDNSIQYFFGRACPRIIASGIGLRLAIVWLLIFNNN